MRPASEPLPPILVSHAERPPLIKAMGRVSSAVEACGCDVMCGVPGVGLVGFQRKTIPDLYSSMHDGRMTRELATMVSKCQLSFLVVEGRPMFTPSGEIMGHYGPNPMRWTRQQYRAYLCSVQARGVRVLFTDDPADTVEGIETVIRWAMKPHHRSLGSVPNMRGQFDLPANAEERQSFLLQGLCPGIGPVRSLAVVKHFGRVPIKWACAKDELLAVAGVGKVSVEALWRALPHDSEVPDVDT